MSYTEADYARMAEIQNERDETERRLERVYRDALYDYNAGLRRARAAYDAGMEAAERRWSERLEAEIPRNDTTAEADGGRQTPVGGG